MAYDFSSQSVGLTSVANARELGGYALPDGRKIRKGLLLRGGSLAKLDDADLALLCGRYRVTRVFDFRTDGEVRSAPDRNLPGVGYVWLPAIDPETEKLGNASLPKEAYSDLEEYLIEQGNAFSSEAQRVAHLMYSEMVFNEYTQLQYAAFLQMVSVSTGAVYWHCSQGKDRTGLGAAFLLAALGADRKLIMEDYCISNDFYKDVIGSALERLRQKGNDIEAEKVIMTFIGSNAAYFEESLDLIDSRFGSMDNYLRGPLCLTDADIQRLQARLLE